MLHPSPRFVLSALGLAAAMSVGGNSQAGQSAEAAQDIAHAASQDWSDRLIVKFRKGSEVQAERHALALAHIQDAGLRQGLMLKHLRHTAHGAMVFQANARVPVAELEALAQSLQAALPDLEYAEPDRLLQPQFVPNDTQYGSQWHYFEATGGLNLPTAWDLTKGAGVVVGVIDTGYRPHVDLAANLLGGYDFIGDLFVANDGSGRDASALDPGDRVVAGECYAGSPARNSSWHGTHVAGTIAAVTNNASGVAGVAHAAKVTPARVLGKCGGYTSDIADAITWTSGGTVAGVPANTNPSRVLNLSLGGSGACAATTQTAINSARTRGTVVVVAAGNSNANVSGFNPANCAGVVAVASVNRSGSKAWYSNFGALIDVAAPGGDTTVAANGILSTLNTGTNTPLADSYAYYQGTSMAAPHVAGVAALMLARNPSLTPDLVESKLKSTARAFPGVCVTCGTGIVNAKAAVDSAILGVANLAEVEPNGTIASAQNVVLNPVKITGSMSTSTDTDYYKITVAAGRTLTAGLTPAVGKNYTISLMTTGGVVMATSTSGTSLIDTLVRTNTSAASVTWVVRVINTSASAGSYTLHMAY
ncbi:S8 family peptidase [Ideonella sp.]|jgi:serine protease|uniref:S8 family peptidase n=1 Tax=Ideonella sp. TaxID=1929293 RepID=UPI0037C0FC61